MHREENAFPDASQHIHKVAQGMDNRECEQENGRAHGAVSIVVELDVSSEENGSQEHQDHIPEQENTSDSLWATSTAVVALQASNRTTTKTITRAGMSSTCGYNPFTLLFLGGCQTFGSGMLIVFYTGQDNENDTVNE